MARPYATRSIGGAAAPRRCLGRREVFLFVLGSWFGGTCFFLLTARRSSHAAHDASVHATPHAALRTIPEPVRDDDDVWSYTTTPAPAPAPTLSRTELGPPSRASEPTSEHPKVLVEDHHDQYSMTSGHRIQRFGRGGANVRNVVVRLLYQWDSMMKHVRVPYWLAAGTLLGEYCQEGFLPNDNNGDVAMVEDDFRQLTADNGLLLLEQRISDGYQLIVRSGLHSNIIAAKFADVNSGFYIDVTVWQQERYRVALHADDGPFVGDALIHTSGNWCANCMNNVLRVARNDVFPLRRCKFESRQFNCPRTSMPLLEQWYNPPFFNCRRTQNQTGASSSRRSSRSSRLSPKRSSLRASSRPERP